MIRMLIHYRTVLNSFFPKSESVVSGLDYSWDTLRNEKNVQGYILALGLDYIHNTIARLVEAKTAHKITNSLKSALTIYPVTSEMIRAATHIDAPIDTAQEIICALQGKMDLFLTENPEELQHVGVNIVSLDEWLMHRFHPSFQYNQSLSIIAGGLYTIQRISEFSSSIDSVPQFSDMDLILQNHRFVDLSSWRDDNFGSEWKSLQELFPLKSSSLLRTRGASYSRCRGKVLSMQPDSSVKTIVMLIHCIFLSSSVMKIRVSLLPKVFDSYLPENIELKISNNLGLPVIEDHANVSKNIQVEFSGEQGEFFNVKVVNSDLVYAERFLI